MLKLERDSDGFLLIEDQYASPFKTRIPGLFCAGGISGPKTIEETLTEARAVTAEIGSWLKTTENYAGQEQYVLEL
jgi:heterodisulfide reductase subunit A-like polyferredoxin